MLAAAMSASVRPRVYVDRIVATEFPESVGCRLGVDSGIDHRGRCLMTQ